MCPRGMSAEATHLPVGDIALWCQSQLSCGHRERTVPAAKPHCSTIRNKNAGNADSISNKTQGATCPPPGARVTRTAVFTRLWAQFAARRSAGIANSVSDKTLGRVIPPR